MSEGNTYGPMSIGNIYELIFVDKTITNNYIIILCLVNDIHFN